MEEGRDSIFQSILPILLQPQHSAPSSQPTVYRQLSSHMHQLNIERSALDAGICFYTVIAGVESVSRMILVD